MAPTERLDPHAVLSHLHNLGYCNISKQQLKEFICDLKKLIKNEMQDSSSSSCEDKENRSGVCVTTIVSTDSNQSYCKCPKSKGRIKVQPLRHLPSSTSMESLCASSASCSSVSDDDGNQCEVQHKLDKAIKLPECSSRPQSSFIRPWRLHPPSTSTAKGIIGGPTQKSDPVKLYHNYRKLWSQQKVPGEDNHSQLRWNIREKMLGQDPQPRPTSQASCRERSKRLHQS